MNATMVSRESRCSLDVLIEILNNAAFTEGGNNLGYKKIRYKILGDMVIQMGKSA